MQLAAADQHRADLGQLAALAREPVRLRVDGEELRGEQGRSASVGHGPSFIRPAAGRMHALAVRVCCPHAIGGRGYVVDRAALCAVAGCGGDSDYANKPRPPAPINVTAAITNSQVSVSPQRSAPARSC